MRHKAYQRNCTRALLLFSFGASVVVYAAFTPPLTIDGASGGVPRLCPVDIDGDGDLDLVGGSHTEIVWYENLMGTGTTWVRRVIQPGYRTEVIGVAIGDVDGDADIDVVASGDQSVEWFENTDGVGGAWIAHMVDPAIAHSAGTIELVDLDRDGELEIVAATPYLGILWWDRVDALTWARRTAFAGDEGAFSAVPCDMDDDGDKDLVCGFSRNGVRWLENIAGTWSVHDVWIGGYDVRDVVAFDLDDNGSVDILAASRSTNEIVYLENRGGGVWNRQIIATGFLYAYGISVADLDCDGDMDILGAAEEGDEIAWWEQRRTSDGVSWVKWQLTNVLNEASFVLAKDLDLDGDIDVLASARDGTTIAWWPNTWADADFYALKESGEGVVGVSVTTSRSWDSFMCMIKLESGGSTVFSNAAVGSAVAGLSPAYDPDFFQWFLDEQRKVITVVLILFNDDDEALLSLPAGADHLIAVLTLCGDIPAGAALGFVRNDSGDSPCIMAAGDETLVYTSGKPLFLTPGMRAPFRRGDVNDDRTLNIADAVLVLSHLFASQSVRCQDAADSNDDGRIDIADAIRLLSHLFAGGPPPPAPYPDVGNDPTPDGLATCTQVDC